jgi:hypothetical protein
MKSLAHLETRREIQERIGRLRQDRAPLWGRMSAPQMMAHCADSIRMGLGQLPTKSKKLPLRYPPLKQLFVYWLPFPKGAPTAPELIAASPRTGRKRRPISRSSWKRWASATSRESGPSIPLSAA